MKTFYKIMQYLFPLLTIIGLIVYRYSLIETGAFKASLNLGAMLIVLVLFIWGFKVLSGVINKIEQPFVNSFLTFILYGSISCLLYLVFNSLKEHLDKLAFVAIWSLIGVLGGVIFKGLYISRINKEGSEGQITASNE